MAPGFETSRQETPRAIDPSIARLLDDEEAAASVERMIAAKQRKQVAGPLSDKELPTEGTHELQS